MILYIFNGLGLKFKNISAAIQAPETLIAFKELHDKLIEFKQYLKREEVGSEVLIVIANYARKFNTTYHRNKVSQHYLNNIHHSNHRKCHSQVGHPNQTLRMIYQICYKSGHTAKQY